MQNICGECGAHNEAGAEFCVFCHTFLAWDEEPEKARVDWWELHTVKPPRPKPPQKADRVDAEPQADTPAAGALPEGSPPPAPPREETPADSAAGKFLVEADQFSVDVAATGEPTLINLRIANTSTIVDGYAVETPDAPEWLTVKGGQIQLLPGTEETVPLRLQIISDTLVPTQNTTLTIRIMSLSQAPAHFDLSVGVMVPALDVPVRVHAEPRMLRVRDQDNAEFDLVIDNSASNRSVGLSFAGSDPELAVRFAFEPPQLDVAPGATESVRVTATATTPEPGQVVSRSLTVTAHDGDRSVDTFITLQQSTTQQVEDPLVGLEVHPSLVRAEDGVPAKIHVVADNRGGVKWAHLKFMATDPEGVVNVMWFPSRIDVAPGKAVRIDAILEAPQPKAGAEVSRTVTVKALDGPRVSTAIATLVQVTSESPMTTLELRVVPSLVRVHDVPSASVQVLVDNKRGRSVARVSLTGADPERAIWFNFSSTTVEVAPGEVRAVVLRLDSWCPPPGEEATRPFTIGASDGQSAVDASGTLVQTSSREAIELLFVRLDPSVLRMAPWRRGTLAARVDNRGGAQPVRVSMTGDDPENVVGFTFAPQVLDIPAGKVANSRVTVKIKRAPSALEMTRPFKIMASDGHTDVHANGELIQAALNYRPLARVLFTALGGLAMILGAFLPWHASSGRSGVQFSAVNLAGELKLPLDFRIFGIPFTLSGVPEFVSLGLVTIALAVLTIFGLTGQTGRLTRLASMFCALLLVAFFVSFAAVAGDIGPGSGAFLTFIGCVVGYVGGLLVKR